MQKTKQYYDCVVIGAGCAGCTAGIYLGMSNVSCVIVGGYQHGGIITTTGIVDNYPGLPDISGPELAEKLINHAKKYCDILTNNVESIKIHDDFKYVYLDNNSIIECKSIIICSGAKYKKMEQLHNNVSYCAFCDGFLYKDKDVAIIGGGNSAFEAAGYLSGLCRTVTIINRTSLFRAFHTLRYSVEKKKNVKILTNVEIQSYENNILTFQGDKYEPTQYDGVFVCIGMMPNTAFLPDEIALNGGGYVIVNNRKETSVRGIYAAGDVTETLYHQMTTASSDATIAALSCVERLRGMA
jgi:thioredoxin reductase (NADPH)